jgi:transcriptional regulator with XRE-family HTH domain
MCSEELHTGLLKKPPEGGLCKVCSLSLHISIPPYQSECNTLLCGVLTPFGDLLYRNIKKHGSVREFARRAEVSPSLFALIRKGETPPPKERVQQWAKLFRLEGADLQEFIDAAAIAASPGWARERIVEMIDRVEQRVAEAEGKYDALEKKVERIIERDRGAR